MKSAIVLACLMVVVHARPHFAKLTVAFDFDDRSAPLYAACYNPRDFQGRYGLHLKQDKTGQTFTLLDGKSARLDLRLSSLVSDSAVLGALLSGQAQAGILAPEEVMHAVLSGQPVRIIAPLQSKGALLVVARPLPAGDWPGFIAWLRLQKGPVIAGYLGNEHMSLLGFEQALDYEDITSSRDAAAEPLVLIRRYRSVVELKHGLAAGQLSAAVLPSYIAADIHSACTGRIIAELHDLPPNRFENQPSAVIAATDSAIRNRGEDISSFLELMAVATHYANNRTRRTLDATAHWLGISASQESLSLSYVGFSSFPDLAFRDGLWNWYFALRLRGAVPDSLAGFMQAEEWLGIPYDSSLVMLALDRAGGRILGN